MDRKTYEDRRRLGYRADPQLISTELQWTRLGRLLLLCLLGAMAEGTEAVYTQGDLRIFFGLLTRWGKQFLIALAVDAVSRRSQRDGKRRY